MKKLFLFSVLMLGMVSVAPSEIVKIELPLETATYKQSPGVDLANSQCLIKVNSQKPEELSRWQVPQLHYPTWAGPVLANKKLYLRSEDRLVCLDLAK